MSEAKPLVDLIKEVMAWHMDKESGDYNECDIAPCHWCEQAQQAIERSERVHKLYNVAIEYLGRKKLDKFPQSTISLATDGRLLVMDAEGKKIRFVANNCKVEQIAAHVIIVRGFTDKPKHVTAYCVYTDNSDLEANKREV